MNCRKAQKHIPFYLAPHESWLKLRDRTALKAHLALCDTCSQECEETRRAIEFFRKYRQIVEANQPLIDEAKLNAPEQTTVKVSGHTRIVMKVASIAEAIVICLGLGLAFLTKKDARKQELTKRSSTQEQAIIPEITITEYGVAVSASRLQTTDGTNIREFLINSKHRLVMNRDTTLSIGPLVKNEGLGCLIKLRSGEIFSHVAQDGNPFEVRSPHGNAVITGTTFDMKVADHETALVVVEGAVRFESDNGHVQVNTSHRSTLGPQFGPTEPVACNTTSVIAWAAQNEGSTTVVDSFPGHELPKLLEELTLSASYPGRPLDLETLDYDQWIEGKREWFRGQFPWVFELQKALRTVHRAGASVELGQQLDATAIPEYPELLLRTGDIWQIAYPGRLYRIIPVIDPNSLSAVAKEYGLDRTWISQASTIAGRNHSKQQGMAFGVAALENCLAECRRLQNSCHNGKNLESLYEDSQSIGGYLENARALIWLSVQNNVFMVPAEHKTELSNLLQQQVSKAHTWKEVSWNLSNVKDCSGCDEHLRRLTDAIEEIIECEREIQRLNITLKD